MSDTVLIIEDEKKISDWLKKYFEHSSYNVIVAFDGEQGLKYALNSWPNIIILDLNLPKMDGIEICQAIRNHNNDNIANLPIIMLTARIEEEDKLKGLNFGADDYITKPFSPKEVIARSKALLRRTQRPRQEEKILRDGQLLLSIDAHSVEFSGENIKLTPNEFSILHYLMQKSKCSVSREQIINSALGLDFDGFDRTIDVYIRNIRHKLKKAGDTKKRIKTIFGVGYKYVESL